MLQIRRLATALTSAYFACSLWFVRMPKPPEVPEIKAGETELQTYRAQLAVLSDTLSLKKVRAGGAHMAIHLPSGTVAQERHLYGRSCLTILHPAHRSTAGTRCCA